MRKLLFSAIVLVCISSCKPSEAPVKQTKISNFLFGQNLWLTAGSEGRPGYIESDLWPKVQESGVKIIRIGGNGYDHNLPGMDTLTQWVKSIKNIGAEPLFQIPKTASPAEAAKLVGYFNKETGLSIKYWCIGNEPYLIQHNSIDFISQYIRELAPAMKLVDPSIKIFVPDEAAYVKELYEALLLNDKYSVAGRDQNGNWYIDGVTFHNYPNAKEYSRSDVVFYSVAKMRGMIIDMKAVMDQANEKYQRNGEDELLWGVTEFNITYNNPDNLNADGIAVPSFINGQFWADVFAMTMEYEGFMATPWCIQESDRPSTYFGYVGGPPDFIPHSTYYHTQMMSQNMSGNYIKMHSNDPWLKVFCSESEKNTVIMIMNQDSARTFEIDFSQINRKAQNSALEITSESSIKAEGMGKIEPNSTDLFVFDKSGGLEKRIHYSQEMALKNLAPETINN